MPTPPGSPNWANKTIWTGDNLYIMRGMNSASVDLIKPQSGCCLRREHLAAAVRPPAHDQVLNILQR